MSKRGKKVKKKNRKIVWIIESLLFIILIQFVSLIKNFQSAREGENRRKI